MKKIVVLSTLEKVRSCCNFFTRLRRCIGIEKIDDDPDYFEDDEDNIKKPPVIRWILELARVSILTILLAYLNTMFVYGYIVMANLLNQEIGINVPLNETQILSVSFELLHFIKPVVIGLMVVTIVLTFAMRVIVCPKKFETSKWLTRGILISFIYPNLMMIFIAGHYDLDKVWWLFKTSVTYSFN